MCWCWNVCVGHRKCVCADALLYHHVNGIHLSIIDVSCLTEKKRRAHVLGVHGAEYCEVSFPTAASRTFTCEHLRGAPPHLSGSAAATLLPHLKGRFGAWRAPGSLLDRSWIAPSLPLLSSLGERSFVLLPHRAAFRLAWFINTPLGCSAGSSRGCCCVQAPVPHPEKQVVV